MLLNEPGWPCYFELDRGQALTVPGADKAVQIRLIDYRLTHEPDYYIRQNPARKTVLSAEVVVEIDGEPATFLCRPFEMPQTIGGVSLYVEAVREWALNAGYSVLPGIERAVRFSAVPAGQPWGSPTMLFPLRAYRWRSSSYQNTWNSLVPYNLLYYHRGEDYGALPDKIEIVAPFDGKVVKTPLPAGDGQSNAIGIEAPHGLRCGLAHMNIESIDPALVLGAPVQRGARLALAGSTCNGKVCQFNDPHLHFGLTWKDHRLSTYPYLMAAYFNTYDDPVVAIAGGHRFALPHEPVVLDGSPSLARPGRRILSWTWKLHDGRTTVGPRTELTYEKPGLYAEELVVRTADGIEDRDALHVRVYDIQRGADMAMGWLHYWPSRAITPGKPVLFCNATVNVRDAHIDFGDGSPVQAVVRDIQHGYASPGLFTAALSGTGPADEPVSLKVRVHVLP